MEQERKRNKKKYFVWIAIGLFLCCLIGGTIWKVCKRFEDNAKLYFKMFADTYEEDEYEFYSLDAYYFMDIGMYFYNAKFKAYNELEGEWIDIDQVVYGTRGKVDNMYCRSWDDLNGFEDIEKEFQRAVSEGIHKKYSQEEIQELLEEAYRNKE